jgi:hypothetical protein
MDITCLLAALLFMTGNALLLAFYVKESKREHFDYDVYLTLDPTYIQKEWDFIIEHRPQWLSAGVINGLAWFFFVFPMVQLSWILSHRGSKSLWMHIAIAILALVGAFTEWISRFLYIGASMAMQMLVKEFNLSNWISENSNDDIGWRTLEVTHIVTRGLISFIDAFEWICLFFIMVFVHISVRRWRTHDAVTFGACWNALGLFIGLLAVLDFVTEILRLDGFKVFGPIAFWYGAVNRLLLIPLWLIILGIRLPYAAMKLNEPTDTTVDLQQQQTNA